MSVILWEVLLTRLYSVILYYHFAFMVVSVAMFGLTLGAVAVALRNRPVPSALLETRMGQLAFWTGVLMVCTMTIQLAIPLRFRAHAVSTTYLALSYGLAALPFIPAGALICLVLTRCQPAGALYAADLAGAGLGCALIPWLLGRFGGPGAVLAAGALACLGGWMQLWPSRRAWARGCLCVAVGFMGVALVNQHTQWLRVRWRHDGPVATPLYESWNAFSRITVARSSSQVPFGWGIAHDRLRQTTPVPELRLEIDSGASTPITAFDGDLRRVDYLRYDVTAIAHRLRSPADTLIIGAGGGRDVLTALAFHQPAIRAVEVNPNIVRAVNGVFGDFSGHLDRRPEVRFVTDEARSYLAGRRERFDILQASLVDTAAATATGAYAFVENGLYTVEAWRLFLHRLKPGGLLSFSRWYYGSARWPVETYRLVVLGSAALRSAGITDPLKHILLIRVKNIRMPRKDGVVNILLSPNPFSPEDVARAQNACQELACEIALSAETALDPILPILVRLPPEELHGIFPLDISPPTDDRPYFFFHARLAHLLDWRSPVVYGSADFHLSSIRILVSLTGLVLLLGLALVALPPCWSRLRGARTDGAGRPPITLPLYFAGIGLAFMFVEIGLIQRLSLFLGHPTYGFTVTLFGLLASSGLGSLAADRLRARVGWSRAWWLLALLVFVLMGMEAGGRWLLAGAVGTGTPQRIALAVLVIAPPAFLMGCAFPLGMGLAQRRGDTRLAWYWAINGSLSTVASVLAMLCALSSGIFATLWLGIGCYALTAVLLHSLTRQPVSVDPTAR